MTLAMTVVMLNRNGGPLVERAVRSIQAQRHPRFELVVLDNGSNDGSYERLVPLVRDDPRCKLVRSETNLGCAGGRNFGIRESSGDVICLIDNDAEAEPEWLASLAAHFERAPGDRIVASKLLVGHSPEVLNGLGGSLNLQGFGFDIGYGEPAAFHAADQRPLYACGNGFSATRGVFERVGLFDEDFVNYYEDVDLCLRARAAGIPIETEPGAVIRHFLLKEGGNAIEKVELCEKNRIRCALLHFRTRYLPRWLASEVRFLRARRDVDEHLAQAYLRAWRWNLRKLTRTLRRRVSIGGGRLRPDRLAEVQPSWGFPDWRPYNIEAPVDQVLLHGDGVEASDVPVRLRYGWYYVDPDPEGHFRWTDGFAGGVATLERPARGIRLTYCHPPIGEPLPRVVEVFWEHVESGTGGRITRLEDGLVRWRTEVLDVEIPAGEVRLHLVTWPTRQEPGLGGRVLGVGARTWALVI